YNSTVGIATGFIATVTGLPGFSAFLIYAVAFISLFGFVLFRKIWRYQRTFRAVQSDYKTDKPPELTEFER
ncbi:MAG: PrsW family intramembrane metalloprotease, partial [Halobacteriota archaeon]